MQVTVGDLPDRTAEVVAELDVGGTVTLTSRGEPIADIVPRRQRPPWLSGEWLREQLMTRQADRGLQREREEL